MLTGHPHAAPMLCQNPPSGTAALRAVALAVRAGAATLNDLRAVLDPCEVFAPRASQGLLAFTPPGHGPWVVACTTAAQLTDFLTRTRTAHLTAAGWLRTTAADLIDHLPAGSGLLLDPDAPHALALPVDWLRPTAKDTPDD